MTYYLFPKAYIQSFISDIVESEVGIGFSPSLHYYLSEMLQQLQKIDTQEQTPHLLCDPESISKISITSPNPLFYYELLELFQTVHLSMDMYYPIHIFFMGESNQSALQCIQRIRNQSICDEYHYASDFTIDNFRNCISNHESSMELIISDAFTPFEMQEDYIQRYEYQTTRIAMLQVCFALCMQKKNGIFILKIGDCFSPLSLDLICILSSFYHKTYFTKPTVSYASSSGRFIVCKGFMHENMKGYHAILLRLFTKILSKEMTRFVHWDIPKMFIMKMEEMNSIFGQPQLEQLQHIHSILTHKYKNDKMNHFIKNNTQKCIQWCIKHKVPFRNI